MSNRQLAFLFMKHRKISSWAATEMFDRPAPLMPGPRAAPVNTRHRKYHLWWSSLLRVQGKCGTVTHLTTQSEKNTICFSPKKKRTPTVWTLRMFFHLQQKITETMGFQMLSMMSSEGKIIFSPNEVGWPTTMGLWTTTPAGVTAGWIASGLQKSRSARRNVPWRADFPGDGGPSANTNMKQRSATIRQQYNLGISSHIMGYYGIL